MDLTSFKTLSVPGAATSQTEPLVIARGATVPVRVLVRNVGSVPLFIAGADQDAVNEQGPTMKTFRLSPGSADAVFVLKDRQKMYCVGSTPGGEISVSISDALPLV